MKEIPLLGGRVTAGIARLGDTVRRPVDGDRSLQHALLDHLESRRFDGAPRYLGIDHRGREMLSFVPGHVPADLEFFENDQLSAAAALLRGFHDATVDFPPVLAGGGEVICHNDFGPPNAVFRDGLPCALIDFDTIAPGKRLWDVAYSAWTWLDIGNPDVPAEAQADRLRLFAGSYGAEFVALDGLVTAMVARQSWLEEMSRYRRQDALAGWAAQSRIWTITHFADLFPRGPR